MVSALAGFVEAGETIEEAVRREVREEAGIQVGAIRYVASQPWPFPASLMIGCEARAESDRIEIDADELESADWFTRDEVKAALDTPTQRLGLPPPLAIAHHLIRAWVGNSGSQRLAPPDANKRNRSTHSYLGSVAAQRTRVSVKSCGSWPCMEWPMVGNDR